MLFADKIITYFKKNFICLHDFVKTNFHKLSTVFR